MSFPLPATDERYWMHIIGQMGGDVAMRLSAIQAELDRMRDAAASIPALQQLQESLGQVRQIGMLGQQLARMAAGEVRLVPEEISLTTVLRDVLTQHKPWAALRGVDLHRAMHPASVRMDPSLLHSFLQQLVGWSLSRSQDFLDIRLDLPNRPARAQLQLRASHPQPRESTGTSAQLLTWCLIEQMARAQGLPLLRQDSPEATSLQIEFPQTLTPDAPPPGLDADDGGYESSLFALSQASRTLNGTHWLVIAARRDLRAEVREALRPDGLMVDFVGSVAEAEQFCRDTLPHGLLYEAVLGGERLQRLGTALMRRSSQLVWVEINAEGRHHEPSALQRGRPGRIGREALGTHLAPLLEAEFIRHL